ncbi:MAG: hypothetical protein CL908_14665 [Deltaproteobacteria bacterium]|nr:hypothetical protein [Deltaproteobacteria bacterium]
MRRRTFEHVYSELCVAVNHRVSRYDLWLLVREEGGDPDELTPRQARFFLGNGLSRMLTEEGAALSGRARRRLEKRILGFDPRYPTPEEWLVERRDPARSVA